MDEEQSPTRVPGLYANESFRLLFDYEVARARRYPSPLTVLHVAVETADPHVEVKAEADEIVAEILHRSLRISDIPTQFDEEFLILLPATNVAGGRAVAERILVEFKTKQNVLEVKLVQMDLYVGLASRYMESDTAGQQLLAEASVAMNEARVKKSKNYVSFSDIAKDIPKPSSAK